MKKQIETCDAVKLIRKSNDVRIKDNNVDVEHWTMLSEDLSGYKNDEIVLTIAADNETYEFRYEFTKVNLMTASIEDNEITLCDVNGNKEVIVCYHSVPVTL